MRDAQLNEVTPLPKYPARPSLWLRLIATTWCLTAAVVPALAQDRSRVSSFRDAAVATAPAAVIDRDAGGNVTVRATRIPEPLLIDGRLEESVYASTASIGDFIQQEPVEGLPATEKTEVWIFYDDRNIYFAARCFDSHPELAVVNEMRRDGQNTNDNESFAVALDTFHDRRNSFLFQLTEAGGLYDGYITDERDMNRDWNTVWNARATTFAEGWTLEMVIPFRSLRFRAGEAPAWGINFKRVVRWKNETSYLTRIPAALGRRGINQISSGATLVGLTPPKPRRNVELKPYGITGLTTRQPAGAPGSTDLDGDAGFDAKLGVTQGLTADFTYNTDFAQVEEDEQQVNLTRFNLLFPEKREFFLEGQGIFSFGGVQAPRGSGGGGTGPGPSNPQPNDVPVMFFSRRIGLASGGEVPIDAGGRLTGKVGNYSIGAIDIRTSGDQTLGAVPTNFGVLRIKRDILRRSAIGALFTDRSVALSGPGRNQTFGVDGSFAFFKNVTLNTYLAKSQTDGRKGDDLSYRAQFDYNADRYGLQVERLAVGQNFEPEVGFKRRSAFTRNTGFLRFSPRPKSIRAVRKFTWDATYDYITDPDGRLQSRQAQGSFRSEFQNGDNAFVEITSNYERLSQPFEVSTGVVIPTGAYAFPEARIAYGFGPQRAVSGTIQLERGAFYDGTRTGISTGRSRIQLLPQLSLEPGLTVNFVQLPYGDFTQTLITTRTSYTLTARAAASALVQYNSSAKSFNTNVRFRWEYSPGSDLFVVYTDGRDTSGRGFPELRNRGVVVKLTRLFRL